MMFFWFSILRMTYPISGGVIRFFLTAYGVLVCQHGVIIPIWLENPAVQK